MAAGEPIPPNRRKQRDIATGQAGRRVADEWTLVEFRPARWLVAALTVLWLWLTRPPVGKRALLAVAWRFTPRRLKLIAGGAATLALIVFLGSVAALLLVLNQLA